MSLPIPEDHDPTFVVYLKIIISVVTLLILAFSSLGEGIKILLHRKRKGPQMGFNKDKYK